MTCYIKIHVIKRCVIRGLHCTIVIFGEVPAIDYILFQSARYGGLN